MSNYDPFRLYSRQKVSSRKGQVLRKKFYPALGNTFTREDLHRVISALTAQGYQVYFPGVSPPTPPVPSHPFSHDVGGIYNSGEVTFPSIYDPDVVVDFSVVWDAVEPQFSSILDVSPSSISNFQFRLDIIAINLWGPCSVQGPIPTGDGSNYISLYFKDNSKSIQLMPSQTLQNNSPVDFISLQSLSQTEALNYHAVYNGTVINARVQSLAKKEGHESTFLISYIETDPSLITALQNKDYNTFNPPLFHLLLGGSREGPISISNSNFTFHIHLQYDI